MIGLIFIMSFGCLVGIIYFYCVILRKRYTSEKKNSTNEITESKKTFASSDYHKESDLDHSDKENSFYKEYNDSVYSKSNAESRRKKKKNYQTLDFSPIFESKYFLQSNDSFSVTHIKDKDGNYDCNEQIRYKVSVHEKLCGHNDYDFDDDDLMKWREFENTQFN